MVKLRPSCVLFGFRLTQNPLVNSPNIDKQLLFPIGSPNCTLSTFPGGLGVVGKCVSKENPKSDLDLGLRVCQNCKFTLWPVTVIATIRLIVSKI